uniref:Glycoprotein gJ n=1 Tax=Cercopithecine herpesvirus 1 TaxID=10325 RepID=Q9YTS0_CHV1|nr:glycoprotein gJ [Macacine alphaherpesvirus 1]
MRSLPFVVCAWVTAVVADLAAKAALATDPTTVGAANVTAVPTSHGANATSADSTPAGGTPGPYPSADFGLPLVIGGLCALTLAAMGAGALLQRCCRRAARHRHRASYAYA